MSKTPSPTAGFGREETLAVLESKGARALAEHVWQKAETDQSLRHRLAVMVLKSRLSCIQDENAVRPFLGQLRALCEFEAEWRECDAGWALFLAEVVSAVETVLDRVPLNLARSQIQEIIQAAEESSSQMDGCYSCGLEIERLEQLLVPGK